MRARLRNAARGRARFASSRCRRIVKFARLQHLKQNIQAAALSIYGLDKFVSISIGQPSPLIETNIGKGWPRLSGGNKWTQPNLVEKLAHLIYNEDATESVTENAFGIISPPNCFVKTWRGGLHARYKRSNYF